MNNKLQRTTRQKDIDHTNQPLALHSVQVHELHDFVLHGPARSQQYQLTSRICNAPMLSMFRTLLQPKPICSNLTTWHVKMPVCPTKMGI